MFPLLNNLRWSRYYTIKMLFNLYEIDIHMKMFVIEPLQRVTSLVDRTKNLGEPTINIKA